MACYWQSLYRGVDRALVKTVIYMKMHGDGTDTRDRSLPIITLQSRICHLGEWDNCIFDSTVSILCYVRRLIRYQ